MYKEDRNVLLIIIGIIAALVFVTAIIGKAMIGQRKRLMQQCIDDGRKEYECYSMLRSNVPSTVVVPLVVR